MVFELHVWGPGLSLPSIDPYCLAAIAYFTQAIPRDQWVLIAGSDAWSPTKELPALRDGETNISGFQNIIDYLRQKSDGEWDLDQHVTNPVDRADITAFSAHIISNAHPLLSLSLYVSSENYSTTTRPSYSTILPWPTQYFIPPQHRALAKSRSSHLGLSSLDIDNADNEDPRTRQLADVIPAALRITRPTVTGLVKKHQTKARFRLDALVDALCEPLQQLLQENRYFLDEERMSSLDCLALGFLSLALKPDVPQKWFREGMQDRYPALCSFVEREIKDCFGGDVSTEDALLNDSADSHTAPSTLPWESPALTPFNAATSSILASVTSALPFHSKTIHAPIPKPLEEPLVSTTSAFLPSLITAGAAVATAAGYLLYATLNGEPETQRLEDMGEAGAMFAGLDLGGGSGVKGARKGVIVEGARR